MTVSLTPSGALLRCLGTSCTCVLGPASLVAGGPSGPLRRLQGLVGSAQLGLVAAAA